MEKIKILIVEHQREHHRKIKKALSQKKIKVLSPEYTSDLKKIKESIKIDDPTDIFTDFFFQESTLLEDILIEIGQEALKERRIWIISGYDIRSHLKNASGV